VRILADLPGQIARQQPRLDFVPAKPKDGEAPSRWKVVGFDGSEQAVDLPHDAVLAYARTARDRFFPAGFKPDTWAATKAGAKAEVKKRAKGEDETSTASP
jgi:CRISPR-associated protein Csb1